MGKFKEWLLGFLCSIRLWCKSHKVCVVCIGCVLVVLVVFLLASCQGLNVLESTDGEIMIVSPVDVM